MVLQLCNTKNFYPPPHFEKSFEIFTKWQLGYLNERVKIILIFHVVCKVFKSVKSNKVVSHDYN